MSLFCFLWTPLFYLFRRSLGDAEGGSGGALALLLGGVAAVFQISFGPLIHSGGFGLSRWMSGFVDIVALPALIPILVYLLFTAFRLLSGAADFTNFALLWLIPVAAIRSVGWSSLNDPALLVLAPLLWTAIAVGIPFFIGIAASARPWVLILAGLAILAIPVLAATTYWAFFSQRTLSGFCLLLVVLAPAVVSVIQSAVKSA
ncbi:MAG: hypothetical protein LBK27_08220 [Treponema sp.]|jgi:hypothetical protein|nr:hypothetical protein [Treponema sp.]